ncbi:MAG: hypothetical protein M1822_009078 [Bathelium mastoideum]|nr:MAG: hypothetical protein M1822_009078 [Bathelium mastoideum]
MSSPQDLHFEDYFRDTSAIDVPDGYIPGGLSTICNDHVQGIYASEVPESHYFNDAMDDMADEPGRTDESTSSFSNFDFSAGRAPFRDSTVPESVAGGADNLSALGATMPGVEVAGRASSAAPPISVSLAGLSL